jgi:hypothetical protein
MRFGRCQSACANESRKEVVVKESSVKPIAEFVQVTLQMLGIQSVKRPLLERFRVGYDDMRPMKMLGLILGVVRDRRTGKPSFARQPQMFKPSVLISEPGFTRSLAKALIALGDEVHGNEPLGQRGSRFVHDRAYRCHRLVCTGLALIFVAAFYVEMLRVATFGADKTGRPSFLVNALAAGIFRAEPFHKFKQRHVRLPCPFVTIVSQHALIE